jgi:hypothetical protein
VITPSQFPDVRYQQFLGIVSQLDAEIGEDPEGEYFLERPGVWASIDVENGWVSGLSIEFACRKIGIDPIDVFSALARLNAATESGPK